MAPTKTTETRITATTITTTTTTTPFFHFPLVFPLLPARQIKETMERGELVAMETVLEMLKFAMMRSTLRGSRGFLVDGYPREEKQGIAFEELVCPAQLCLYFRASDGTMLKRMRKRGETSGRVDDNEVTMRERLKTFRQHSKPVVNHYRRAGKLIEVDAEESSEVVFRETIDAIKEYLLKVFLFFLRCVLDFSI